MCDTYISTYICTQIPLLVGCGSDGVSEQEAFSSHTYGEVLCICMHAKYACLYIPMLCICMYILCLPVCVCVCVCVFVSRREEMRVYVCLYVCMCAYLYCVLMCNVRMYVKAKAFESDRHLGVMSVYVFMFARMHA
jgi:hypothetical protein